MHLKTSLLYLIDIPAKNPYIFPQMRIWRLKRIPLFQFYKALTCKGAIYKGAKGWTPWFGEQGLRRWSIAQPHYKSSDTSFSWLRISLVQRAPAITHWEQHKHGCDMLHYRDRKCYTALTKKKTTKISYRTFMAMRKKHDLHKTSLRQNTWHIIS